MEIHRFEKLWIAAALLLIVAFIGTVTYGAVGEGVKMVDDDGGTVEPEVIRNGNFGQTPNFQQPGVYETDDGVAVYVVSRQFLFEPGTSQPIRVPANTRVTFYITSADVIHGFSVPGTNLNTMVIPGQVTKLTVTFDETGRYGIVCNEYCGAGHHTMEGSITVVAQENFDATTNATEGA